MEVGGHGGRGKGGVVDGQVGDAAGEEVTAALQYPGAEAGRRGQTLGAAAAGAHLHAVDEKGEGAGRLLPGEYHVMPFAVRQACVGMDRGVRMAGAGPHLAAGVQRGAEVIDGARDFAVEQPGRLPPLGDVRAGAAP